jgi:hypothetical protein
MEENTSEKVSHTPCPWKVQVNGYGQFAVGNGTRSFSGVVAKLNQEGQKEETTIANATLIASAPDMAEALQACIKLDYRD